MMTAKERRPDGPDTPFAGPFAGLTWEVYNDLESARTVWLDLEAWTDHRIFQTHAWLSAWFETLGRPAGARCRILVGSRDGRPQILLPLSVKSDLGCRRLTWLADDWNDYNAPLITPDLAACMRAEPDSAAMLWYHVVRIVGDTHLLDLRNQCPTIGTAPNVSYHPLSRPAENCAYILALKGPTGEVDESVRRKGKTLSRYRSKLRQLEKSGTVAFRVVGAAEDRARSVALMLSWKDDHLRERGSTNPFADPAAVRFLAAVAAALGDRSIVLELTLDGRPLAISLLLVEKDNLILYQTSYDRSFARQSPGTLLLNHLVEMAVHEGYSTLDFSVGNEGYKTELCNREVRLGRALAAESPYGFVAAGLSLLKLETHRRIKTSAFAYRAALSVNRARQFFRGAPAFSLEIRNDDRRGSHAGAERSCIAFGR